MRKNNQYHYDLFEYDVDIERRVIYIGTSVNGDGEESGVDAFLSEKVIKSLVLMDKLQPDSDKPINLIINGPGGDYYHAMAIYDAIKQCKSRVIATVYGSAMSAHSIIFQAAHERIMCTSSRQMLHYGYFGHEGHTKIFKSWAKESERIDLEMENIYLDRIKQRHPSFTRTKLKELLNFDTILSAEESLELGLCDRIL